MTGKKGQLSMLAPIIFVVISGLAGIFILSAVISMFKFVFAIGAGIVSFMYLPKLFRKADISKDISMIAGGVFSVLIMIFIAKLSIFWLTAAFIGLVIIYQFLRYMTGIDVLGVFSGKK